MFKKLPYHLIKYSIAPAILYLIPVTIFLMDATFSNTWLLFAGNGIHLFYIFGFVYWYMMNTKHKLGAFAGGLAVSSISIVLSCLLIPVAVLMLAPQLMHVGAAGELTDKPPTLGQRTNFEVWFILYSNAILGNVTAGSFAALMGRGVVLLNKQRAQRHDQPIS